MITITLSPCLSVDKPFAAVTKETVAFVGAEVADGLQAALFDGSGTCLAVADITGGQAELDLDTQEAVEATAPVGPGEAVSVWLVVGDKDTHIATVPCKLIRNLIDDGAVHPSVPAERYPTVNELAKWLEEAGEVREGVCTCAKAAASSAEAASQSAAQAGRALADAQTARGDAQAARDAAKASETAAAGSAGSAAASATQAQEAKAGAEGAKAGAETAKADAETARDAAAQSAGKAAQSADEAEAAKESVEEAAAWVGKTRFRASPMQSVGMQDNGLFWLCDRDQQDGKMSQTFLHGDGVWFIFQGGGKTYILDKDLNLAYDFSGIVNPFYSHEGANYWPNFVVRDGKLIVNSGSSTNVIVYDLETRAKLAQVYTASGRNSNNLIYNERSGHVLIRKAKGTELVTAMDVCDTLLNKLGETMVPMAIAAKGSVNSGPPTFFAQCFAGRTYVAWNCQLDTTTGTPLYALDSNDGFVQILDAAGDPIMLNANCTIQNTSGYLSCWWPGFYSDNALSVAAPDGTKHYNTAMSDGVYTWLFSIGEDGEHVWTKRGNLKNFIDLQGLRNSRPYMQSGCGGPHPNGVGLYPNIVAIWLKTVYSTYQNRLFYNLQYNGGSVMVPGSKLTAINTHAYQTYRYVAVYT